MLSRFFGSGDSRTPNQPARPAPGASAAGSHLRRALATYEKLGQTLVATLTVQALSGTDATELAEELSGQLEVAAGNGGVRHVVLDLQNVQYMDSTCVGTLVELFTRLREHGGRIALVNTAQNVEYLFKLTRLDRVFPLCKDVMKAIEMCERAG